MNITSGGACVLCEKAHHPIERDFGEQGYLISWIPVNPYGRESDFKLFVILCSCGRLCFAIGVLRAEMPQCCLCKNQEMAKQSTFTSFCKICDARAKLQEGSV